jgi:copper transport protein
LLFASRPPANDSAEAGFARDMIVHHAQAVQMAEIVRDRTQTDSMRLIAPLLADWTHAVAAAVWMGGLLGFAVALCSRPYRSLAPDRRMKLRERSVRRFSAVATFAVVVLACTGLYAALLHVPSLQALLATPYGRALMVKLSLLSLLLGIGTSNLLLRGRGPFARLVVVELLLALGLFVATGFLTSLPPASSA